MTVGGLTRGGIAAACAGSACCTAVSIVRRRWPKPSPPSFLLSHASRAERSHWRNLNRVLTSPDNTRQSLGGVGPQLCVLGKHSLVFFLASGQGAGLGCTRKYCVSSPRDQSWGYPLPGRRKIEDIGRSAHTISLEICGQLGTTSLPTPPPRQK